MSSGLREAIIMATMRHHGVNDKNGEPYIYHPLRVMNTVRRLGEHFACVAVLHDVVEDTFSDHDEGLDHLRRMGFPPPVVEGVHAVSRLGTHGAWNETYRNFIKRAVEHGIGKYVKVADLEDNAARLAGIPDVDERHGIAKRYQWAIRYVRERWSQDSMIQEMARRALGNLS